MDVYACVHENPQPVRWLFMGPGGAVAMSLITGCYIDLIYRINTSSCGPEMDHKQKGVPLGRWFENNWNSKGWLWLPYLKRQNRQFFLPSRLRLIPRLCNDVNEETPGLIRSLKAQVQTYRVRMRPCTSCDSGAGIKLSARPIFKALILRCQMPEPLQTRLMERQRERGGGKNTTAGKTGAASNRMRGQSLCLRGMANPWLYCGTGDVRDFSIKRQQCRGRLGTKVFLEQGNVQYQRGHSKTRTTFWTSKTDRSL